MSDNRQARVAMPFAVGIFTSAYLLFQVQPMIARQILPWYGGSPAVWTTCVLFFQVSLLAGYFYAHLIVKWLQPRRQVMLHLALLGLSLFALPITPNETWKPSGADSPTLGILLLLTCTIGFPCLMISASGPLLQSWFSQTALGQSPYRLYALSNLGSLLGLLFYPCVLEPGLTLQVQSTSWSACYGLYTCVCAWSALPLLRFRPGRSEFKIETSRDLQPRSGHRILWLVLTACGSTLLLATTNQACQDVAVIPFLWVAPLTLYLLSFILCFAVPTCYKRPLWVSLLVVAASALVILLRQDYEQGEWPLIYQTTIYLSAMFVCSMICHGELARLKPPPAYLTSFYLMVALGGALGGLFVNLAAPHLFNGYWELHGAIVATVLLLGICSFRDKKALTKVWHALSCKTLWGIGLVTLSIFLWMHIREQREDSIATRRSFYGVLNVYEFEVGSRQHQFGFFHGRIKHGLQFQKSPYRLVPTTYYNFDSGIGVAIKSHPMRNEGSLNVGVIGLGVGTIAAHGLPGDNFRFYEINPDVERLARDYFTFLSATEGNNVVVLGDGRIVLERELQETGSRQFDVLAVDAFNGDGIPVHLLTREAFELYWTHLKPDGILALHLTNRHFDLSDVARMLAQDFNKQAIHILGNGKWPYHCSSDWVLITSNQRFLASPGVTNNLHAWSRVTPKEIRWTDDYSNLLGVLSIRQSHSAARMSGKEGRKDRIR